MINIQHATIETTLPTDEDIHTWVDAVLKLAVEMNTDSISEKQNAQTLLRAAELSPNSNPNTLRSNSDIELTVRIVDEEEIIELNRRYRGQEKATNVLSFPCELPESLGLNLLGDIVVCAPVVKSEADSQHKEHQAHWAHMIVHGTLHLLGFDHVSETQALKMESLETRVLAHLGFPDPYH
ncbi:MAG: rRNA maturation RNase YbeY [Gammaproteobacteria bacterium]|nr:rRNA maturation RNase YbeY [Gammaproteobacteria bacterium]NNJ85292.1 rRNA maturation RNase YbeY [Gammaproteobacteria bacterium]